MYASQKKKKCIFGNVNMGAPLAVAEGLDEGRAARASAVSGVLGKGQCTQLHSGGKCKTNMPHTCFPLSCHGSAFKDSTPPLFHLNTNTHIDITVPHPLLRPSPRLKPQHITALVLRA